MGLINRKPKLTGRRPSDEEIRQAAAAVNAGDQALGDQLVADSGDYGKETALRVFRHIN